MAQKADLKIVLLGASFVGKSCLVEKFLYDKFTEGQQPTVAAGFGSKTVFVQDNKLTLGIWDTAGSERYESLSKMYYRGAGAAIVCYDMTNHDTFDRLRFWVNELRENEKNCPIYLVGTKLDAIMDGKTRQVSAQEVSEFSSEIEAKTFETSAKKSIQVEELFLTIAEDFLNKKNGKVIQSGKKKPNQIIIEPTLKKDKSGCC
ncbi:ras-related protein rab-24 [Anaeramoeba ignava]|uniref:Ras-related protein rab-24 n=1 Tax=Anaeramoeba ignava TaxID=1746090 RepID=A0A9Q0L719_ANAIG|nr:ras-related protein rab-24 [Anaeramoeba ignava]